MQRIKNYPNLILMLLLSLLVITSCQDDDGNAPTNPQQDETIPDTFSEYFGNQISRDFIGNIIDTNNNPIDGVTITIGNATATTDSNGVFIIDNANVNERFGYVKAEKAGYIHASRSVVPSNGTNKVTIMMLAETVVGAVNSGMASNVTGIDGSSVSFDGNFIKEDGSSYSGSVDVIMHHLDPSDPDMPMQMPGMLYAQNEDGAERMLQTLGMLAVELRGTSGEDLNLAEGSTSEIQIPVDASLLAIAPATIPLWYFDEVNGYWKEEGQATLQGNMYVGTVSHFSFWNCDIPAEAITLCVNTIDANNTALANLQVSITSATFGTTYGYTNQDGEVCGYVPSNETLELNVFSYDICGNEPLLTQTIGPFSEDAEISLVVDDTSDTISETVTGTFLTCNEDPVSNGYVQLTYGNQTFIEAVNDGTFEINLIRCADDNTFSIKGSDYSNIQTTDTISYTFTTPTTDIGNISACNAVTEFIEYTIDNGDSIFIFDNINASFFPAGQGQSMDNSTLEIFGSSGDQNSCFFLYGVLNQPEVVGTYGSLNFGSADDVGIFIGECLSISGENNNISYNVTDIGDIGEYIDINFSGTFEDFEGNAGSINGVVHVLRDN